MFIRTLFHRLQWGVIGLAEGVLLFELIFVFCPQWIPVTIQVMALRGPFGECLEKYKAVYRPDRYSCSLTQGHVEIRHHPEFPPHTIQTHQVGHLDLWVRDANPIGPWDILATGDSFVYGYGVSEEDTFVSRVERTMGLNILNTGTPYWSSGEVRHLVESSLESLHPKKVVYFIYANDFSDEPSKLPVRVIYDRYLKDLVKTKSSPAINPSRDSGRNGLLPSRHQSFRAWLSQHSVFYELMKMIFKLGDYHSLGVRKMVYSTRRGPMGLWPSFLNGEDHNFSKTHELGRTILERDIKAVSALTHKLKIPLILVYIPCREQVYFDPRMAADMKEIGVDQVLATRLVDHARLELTEIAKRRHALFYDMTPDLRQKRDEMPLYFYHDRHFTPEGHAAAAEGFVNFLRSHS